MPVPTRILLADPHPLFRLGIRHLIHDAPEYEIAGETGTVMDAVVHIASVPPTVDLIVMDMSFTDGSGATIIERAGGLPRPLPVLVLTGRAGGSSAYPASILRAGASGFLPKTASPEEVVHAIGRVSRGGRVVPDEVVDRVYSTRREGDDLSMRELDVLRLLAEGGDSVDIGRALNLSASTVRTYRHRVREKLGLGTVAELTRYAMERGIA